MRLKLIIDGRVFKPELFSLTPTIYFNKRLTNTAIPILSLLFLSGLKLPNFIKQAKFGAKINIPDFDLEGRYLTPSDDNKRVIQLTDKKYPYMTILGVCQDNVFTTLRLSKGS